METTYSPPPPGDTLTADRGFTLMEILVAVLILGVLMTTLFASFNAFLSSSTVVTETLNRNERINTLLGHLERDLNALYITLPPRYKVPKTAADEDPFRFHGVKEQVSGFEFSRLTFTSLNHLSFGTKEIPGVARIAYYARVNQTRQGHAQACQGYQNDRIDLCRSDGLRPFEEIRQTDCDPVLMHDISGFELSYIDADGDEYDEWDSESDTYGYRLPSSIRVKITLWSKDNFQGKRKNIIQTEIPLVVARKAKE
jgi:general secretion pathway protein J